MTSQNAASFFASVETSTAVRVEVASLVNPGETVALATDMGFAIETRVEKEGWYLSGDKGGFLCSLEDLQESAIAPQMIQNFNISENFEIQEVKVGRDTLFLLDLALM